jgi:transposase
MVRTDAHQLRPVAADTPEVESIKVVARVHKTMIWERTRHVLRLRHALREYFPAALEAFDDLDAADTLELLSKAPEPVTAAKLTSVQIRAALTHARRRDIDTKTTRIQDALRSEQLGRHKVITAAYAATTRSVVAVLVTLNEQIKVLQEQVAEHFGQHPDAEIIMSQPGMGPLLGARVLAEFGDAPGRYVDAKARKNYAGTSPITRASGKKKVVVARFVHNDRLIDALILQAQSALRVSPGARAYYDKQRDRGLSYNAALRQLANRLVGILHGCLKTRTNYDEATAWPQPKDAGQPQNDPAQQNAA